MSESKKQHTERQHFVPKCYLKSFASCEAQKNTWIWVYKKGTQANPQKRSIKSIAWKSDYYEDEEKDNKIENILSEIENLVCPIIQNLVASSVGEINLTDVEKGELACFIALLFSRNPAFRDPAKEIRKRAVKTITDHILENDRELKEMFEKNPLVKDRWDNGKIELVIHERATLPEMINIIIPLAESFLIKQWHFFIPPQGQYLITSDNPVYFNNIYLANAGPAHPSTEVIIHLRKDLALVITPCPYDMKVFRMDSQKVKKFNRGVAKAALEYVYSSTESSPLGRMIAKMKESSAKVGFF